jgi:predicted metal-dependent phosphoesterase TrpH
VDEQAITKAANWVHTVVMPSLNGIFSSLEKRLEDLEARKESFESKVAYVTVAIIQVSSLNDKIAHQAQNRESKDAHFNQLLDDIKHKRSAIAESIKRTDAEVLQIVRNARGISLEKRIGEI